MQDMNGGSKLLSTFKTKIEESVALVPNMVAEEKLKAVQFWNVVSEKLQEIVNNSAADISALAFELDKESVSKAPDSTDIVLPHSDKTLQNPQHLVTVENSSGMLLAHSNALATFGNSSSVGQNSTIHLAQNELAVLRPDSTDRLSPSLVLNSPTQTLLLTQSLTVSSIEDQNARTEDSLKPSENPIVQIEDKSRTYEDEITTQTNQTVPIEISTDVPASSKGPQTKKGSTRKKAGQTQKPNKPEVEAVGSSNVESKQAVPKKKLASKETGCPRRQPPRSSRWKNYLLSGDKDQVSMDTEESATSSDNDIAAASVDSEDEGGISGSDEMDKVGDKDVVSVKTAKGNKKKISLKSIGASEVTEVANLVDANLDKSCQQKPFLCSECDARFATRGNLIVHCRRHTGEKPYGCPQCSAKFSTRGNLKRHVKTHSGEKPWHCAQCGGSFTEKKSLKVHMRKHTGEKPYKCNVCGKSFAQTGILQTHMAMHMDQKEHLCEHCGKSFRQKSQLRLHMMRHEGFRKYQCDTCPAKFLTKGDLERHNRVHTGERPFVCEVCGRTFTRQQSLNEHMNRHYGLKPYQCKYCGKGFAEMSACYKHVKKHERSCNFGSHDETKSRSDSEEQILTEEADLGVSEIVETIESSDSEQKFTSLVHEHVDVAGSEVVVETRELDTSTDSRPKAADFSAINILACASSFQQNS